MTQQTTGGSHRGDIDGLRAIAVLVVVAFHAGVPGLEAGFVGVDVFFVVSGFLIMGLLLRELDATGRVSLASFWARRIRRLGPALTVVLLATLLATVAVVSVLRWRQIALESAWASVYVSNIGFALASRGYFAEGAAPSPLLHTWSLAVEEQFYLVWPLMVALCAAGARRLVRPVHQVIAVVVVGGGVVSFAASVVLTQRGTPWAYYSLLTRWWEIGLGIGCALWCRRHRVGRRAGEVLSVLGIGALAASLVLIEPTTPFPGWVAILPTAGTAALLVGGTGPGAAVGRVLAVAPMQLVGRWSYSWYLWHWPVLVIADAARWTTTTPQRVLAAALSLVPAVATHYLVERPVRFNRTLATSMRWSVVLSVSSVLVVAVGAGALVGFGSSRLDEPLIRQLDRAQASRAASFEDYCRVDGRQDPAGCGPGTGTVMLVGDSHASHWAAGLEAASDQLGVPLAIRSRGGCPAWDVAVTASGTATQSEACRDFLAQTRREIDRIRPAVVVVASAS